MNMRNIEKWEWYS